MKRLIFLTLVLISFSYANSSSFEEFAFRAWGVGGDKIASKVTFTFKDENYTAIPYSTKDISFLNASTSGNFYLLIGKLNDKDITPIQLSSDYINSDIVVKIFKSKDVFNSSTFVYETNVLFTSGNHQYFNIKLNDE